MTHEHTVLPFLRNDYSFVPDGGEFAPAPAPASILGHPVFAAMDSTTQGALIQAGHQRDLQVGDPATLDDEVAFVTRGMIGTLSPDMDVCVAVVGAGGVMGMERCVSNTQLPRTMALADSTFFAAPLRGLIDALGRHRVTDLCLRHTLARLQAMQQEAACNASHLVPQRLAKWLIRLHRANGGRDIHITQAELARLIGVQRTSVNAAAKQLQVIGAARFVRGRISLQDVRRVLDSACGCSA